VKFTLAQIPATAGAIAANTDRVLDALGAAVADASTALALPAHAFAGEARDLNGDPNFRAEAHAAYMQVSQSAREAGVRLPQESPVGGFFDGTTVASRSITNAALIGQEVRSASVYKAKVVVLAGALPYRIGGPAARRAALIEAARENKVTVVFVNHVGGQDTKIYDGGSMVVGPDGTVLHQSPLFDGQVATVDLGALWAGAAPSIAEWPSEDAQTWEALVVGTRDYVKGNGFADVVIGLSGGIDSAVVAAIAVDALGAEHVHGIGMPGPYSSDGSVTDAQALAANLGVRLDIASIKDTYEAEVAALGSLLDGPGAQVAKENIQARLRALHLFTVANARNALVLNTCQRSEDAVGYATYGGDALGGYAPMVDLLKRDVYRLAAWRNTVGEVIPRDTITKPPSAELAPGQTDQDTLPPYEVLDTIIDRHLTHRDTPEDLIARIEALPEAEGRDVAADVQWTLTMIDRSEWKRQQAPLGPSIALVPFAERDMPVTNGRRHRVPVAARG
jgi:NAD+ synthase (glutamine-hydrolysing)